MPKQHLDVFLKKEDFMLRDMLRGFVDKEIMPVRQQIDDDKDHKIVTKILQDLTSLGLQKAPIPPEYGGNGAASALTACVAHEELSRGDSGICTGFNVTGWAWIPAIAANNTAVLDRFAPDFCGDKLRMGCFVITVPGGSHGGGGCDIENPALQGRKIRTRAKLVGNEWVIDGQKMWASNCGGADLYCVVCNTDPELGNEGVALIYVPEDAKGVSFGKDENKAGMRGDKNHPMFLENLRVAKEWRAAGPGADADLFHNDCVIGLLVTGAMAVGQAQGTFETVLKCTGERIVADKPIRQHSIAAGMLADMAIGTETARWSYLAAAHMYDHQDIYGPPISNFMLSRASAAKVYAADMAVMVTNKAMELMGA